MRHWRFYLALFVVFTVGMTILARTTPGLALARYYAPPRRAVVPVAGLKLARIGDSWGAPRSGHRRHEGADLFAPRNTPVLSATDGEVLRVGANPLGGNAVWTVGQGATLYYYAHLDHYAAGLEPGQRLRRGDVIGYVGNTGNARTTPPHLHFGTYPLSNHFEAVDPVPLLRSWNAETIPRPPSTTAANLDGGLDTRGKRAVR